MRKYIFAQVSFYLQGILYDINQQDTSFLDCKNKHMMKCGAPPDKCGVQLPYDYLSKSMVSQAELILRVITLWFLDLSQFFRGGMDLFNFYSCPYASILMYSALPEINQKCSTWYNLT